MSVITADDVLERAIRPGEEFRVSWDFVNDLVTGDTVASQIITATDSDGTVITGTFLQSPGLSGTKLTVQVQNGTDARDYYVTFQATTTAGDVFRRTLLVRCRA